MDITVDLSARSSRIQKISYREADAALGAGSPGRFYDDHVKETYVKAENLF